MGKLFLNNLIYFIERRIFAQNYKFTNKNYLLCAWRDFKKLYVAKWNFKPQISPLIPFWPSKQRFNKGLYYSRVHISSDEVFSKILKKPSIVLKKWHLIWKPLVFLIRWSKNIFFWKFFFQNGRLKKGHFPALLILNIFLWKFYGMGLGLVEFIDAKGIDVN
jgi:hypothetical protein